MRARVVELSGPQARYFCIRLWHELTITGRVIWSDEALDMASQLNALKWLDEIQHRVWDAHANPCLDVLANLLDQIISHCERAPALEVHVRVALDRALLAASSTDTTPNAPDP